MESSHQETISDFDLNFLDPHTQQSVVPLSKIEKQRRQVLFVKKKTIATTSLITKYYEKKDTLDLREKHLFAAKEECKQLSIQYKDSEDKNSNLQQENDSLQEANKELRTKSTELQNQIEAMSSHCRQLQLLVKENETRIQSLMLESNLEKSEAKDFSKKLTTLEKDQTEHIQHILKLGEVVLGTRKVNRRDRIILEKYRKQGKKLEIHAEDAEENDVFEDVPNSPGFDSTAHGNENIRLNPKAIGGGKACDDADHDSDSGTEVVSNDTGRGSSRAFSGSDKFPSPDYFNDSPPSPDNEEKEKPRYCNIATSPMKTSLTVSRSASPIHFDDAPSPDDVKKEKPRYVNIGTSPMKTRLTVSRSASPINFDAAPSPEDEKKEKLRYINNAISPIHFDDAPSPDDEKKEKPRCVNIASSLIKSRLTINRSASPIHFDDRPPDGPCTEVRDGISPPIQMARTASVATSPCKRLITHRYTSTSSLVSEEFYGDQAESTKHTQYTTVTQRHRLSTKGTQYSPVKQNDWQSMMAVSAQGTQFSSERQNSSMSIDGSNDACDTATGNESPVRELLQSNASDVSGIEENTNDFEVANILSIMCNESLQPLITPIPPTPSKSRNAHSRSDCSEQTKNLSPEDTLGCFISVKEWTSLKSTVSIMKKETEKIYGINKRVEELEKIVRIPVIDFNVPTNEDSWMPYDDVETTPSSMENDHSNSAVSLEIESDHVDIDNNNIISPVKENRLLTAPDIQEKCQSSRSRNVEINERRISEAIVFENETSYDSDPEERPPDERPPDEPNEERAVAASDHSLAERKLTRARRLTKLEIMRRKLIPKNKIKSVPDPKKLSGKSKLMTNKLKEPLAKTDAASLNNQAAYEKAVEFMIELRSKENTKAAVKHIRTTKTKPVISTICDKLETSEDDHAERNSPGSGNLETTTVQNPNTPKKTSNKKKAVVKVHKPGDTCLLKTKKQRTKSIIDSLFNVDTVGETKTIAKETKVRKKQRDSTETPTKAKLNSPENSIITRSGRVQDKESVDKVAFPKETQNISIKKEEIEHTPRKSRISLKRPSAEPLETSRRVLRSHSNGLPSSPKVELKPIQVNVERNKLGKLNKLRPVPSTSKPKSDTPKAPEVSDKGALTTYDDLDLFSEVDDHVPKKKPRLSDSKNIDDPDESVLCAMIVKYGLSKMKYYPSLINNDAVVKTYHQKIVDSISKITELPLEETEGAMKKFVAEIKSWDLKCFTKALVKYLADPERKNELLGKKYYLKSPAMSKSEIVVLYIAAQLRRFWPNVDFIDLLLDNIEYTLFRLNNTPDIGVVESMSHLYAVVCRYIGARLRLRQFMIDAMYCTQYKAIPLIKHCLDVWMHALPLAHLGIAKTPLVTCLVYLLHFFKCQDYGNRIGEIRRILKSSYFYQITEWNEPKILDTFRSAIKNLRDIPSEKKMMRTALILLAKRHGARWCDKNIVKGILQPIMEDNAPEQAKLFSVSVLGAIVRPYPANMKVNVEVVFNQLLERLEHNPSPKMEEAIFTSLIVSNYSTTRVIQALLRWRPEQVSPEMDSLLRDFVRTKPVKQWRKLLSKMSLVCSEF